ncbi:response regulator transcription factor [Allofournierella massiliensis]|uniref:Stage 0 sporulation protein A homolog n=1 Tax=Allofournierella massiliensis TaxID=1650663 RepID=A0ABT7UNX0_9FIRM|nr:response regulator transcription factor [Fournierella massiliensis]MDM8200595.1 response regulator transcription factor [Fournierella massiliensis]
MNPILIVDDERPIAELIELTLLQAGYRCEIALDGETAADKIETGRYDLILLDIMLPGVSGYELMEYIRPTGTPVIFLTAKGMLADRVRGLRMGADDYIVKPFEPLELLARVESVLRRAGRGGGLLRAFGVVVDPAARKVEKDGVPVPLTPREFDLLVLLLRNQGIALYRDVMYERVWGGEEETGSRTLDLHIQRLRKKLGLADKIKTVYKIGYLLEVET